MGDRVFLRVLPQRLAMKDRKRGNLSPRFMGPYRIIERVGSLAYRLALPETLVGLHDVFHVSQMQKFIADPRLEVPKEDVEVRRNLTYAEQPVGRKL